MGLHITNERTVALIRELAMRTGASHISAVEALLSDLDRSITMRQNRQIRRDSASPLVAG